MFEYAHDVGIFLSLGVVNIMLALLFVVGGFWSIWRGVKNATNIKYMGRQMVTWQVIAPEAEVASPLVAQATNAVTQLRGWGLIGAGIVATLVQLCWMGFAAFTNINPTNGQPVFGAIFNMTTLISLLVGYGAGHAAGVRHLRQRAHGTQPAYADIRRRTLADYRAPFIGWLSPVLTLAWIIVTIIALPHVQATDTTPIYLDPHSPDFLLESLALPAQMVAITVIMECVLRWVAQLPRLLILPDPALAQRADDIIRATTIGALQGWEIFLVSTLGTSQFNALVWHLPPTPPDIALHTLEDINLLFVLSGLIVILFAHGRLGGTMTRWPWQNMSRRRA